MSIVVRITSLVQSFANYLSVPYSIHGVIRVGQVSVYQRVAYSSRYAASRTNRLSIPIPSALSGVTTILPAIAGLLLGGGYEFTRHQERHQSIPRGQTPRPPLVIVANTLIFIYSSVVITLLGTHVGPPLEVNCRLAQRWSDMFSHKKDEAIRTIQDTFKCCGHMNSHDKAWPFPDRGHDIHACENAFGRTIGCHGPWKQEEQRLAGIMMAVVGLVFVWQVGPHSSRSHELPSLTILLHSSLSS